MCDKACTRTRKEFQTILGTTMRKKASNEITKEQKVIVAQGEQTSWKNAFIQGSKKLNKKRSQSKQESKKGKKQIVKIYVSIKARKQANKVQD